MAYQNFFAAKLQNDIGAADTTITLDTAPSATSGRMVLEARNPTQREIIKYTGVSGTQLTGVTRGQGGTTAKSHTKNSLVEMNLTAQDIQDLYDAFTSFAATNNDWRNLPQPVGTVTANGNHNYNVDINGFDARPLLSEGMRVRVTRTVAAPMQCASFNGTTQYYSKSSPAGMTFTDDFTVSAYVKLNAYGSQNTIASRYNGTSGWDFKIDSNGGVVLQGFNAGSGNVSYVTSNQSIPLNKWVHVVAQLDMSAFTATPTTSYVMIDCVDVLSTVTRSGTNPTALVQAGNLEIGSRNGGTQPFNGRIQQVAIYGAKVTQATHLAAMNQGLTGSETSAVAVYSFNNSVNDLTTNANNLTANGGVLATTADSPFGNSGVSSTVEYGIIVAKPTFSTNTTLTIQVPEGCALPTTGGVSAVDYSYQKAPYGFPGEKSKWQLYYIHVTNTVNATPTINTWANIGTTHKLKTPIGAFKLKYKLALGFTAVSGNNAIQANLSTSTSSEDNPLSRVEINGNSIGQMFITTGEERDVNNSVATDYYIVGRYTANAGSINIYAQGADTPTIITAEVAYL